MDLSWTTDEYGGLTLVTARVRNRGAVPRRVRIDNRLDGPVLPPRQGGVPEPVFDVDGVTLGVSPGEIRSVGFACPATARDPPLEIVDAERVDDATAVADPDPTVSALADLGDARPPRDAVPRPAVPRDDGRADDGADTITGDGTSSDRGHDRSGGARSDVGSSGERPSDPPAERSTDPAEKRPLEPIGEHPSDPPTAVTDWLDAVEDRIEYGERLTDASVPEATAVLRETDGLSAVDRLDARLAEDARALRTVADRATALAERAETADVPLDPLRRLA